MNYEAAILKENKPYFRPSGGENWLDVAARITTFIAEKQTQQPSSLLIVSHNHPIECAIGKMTNRPVEEWNNHLIDNGSIHRIIKHRTGWRVANNINNPLAN